MRIAILDLMPLLWILCTILSAALALYGERGAPARTVPAATAAMILYFMGHPPRLQVAVFIGIYALCAAVYAVLSKLSRRTDHEKTEKI